MTAAEGATASLICNSSRWEHHAVVVVLWYKGASEVPFYTFDVRDERNSRHIAADHFKKRAYFDVKQKPPVLLIQNASKSDEGVFRCRVSNVLFMAMR